MRNTHNIDTGVLEDVFVNIVKNGVPQTLRDTYRNTIDAIHHLIDVHNEYADAFLSDAKPTNINFEYCIGYDKMDMYDVAEDVSDFLTIYCSPAIRDFLMYSIPNDICEVHNNGDMYITYDGLFEWFDSFEAYYYQTPRMRAFDMLLGIIRFHKDLRTIIFHTGYSESELLTRTVYDEDGHKHAEVENELHLTYLLSYMDEKDKQRWKRA